MGWILGLLAPRLGAIPAKLIVYVGIPLLIAGLIWWRVDAWGDRRFDAGFAARDAQVAEANRQLKEAAAKSATQADDRAAKRAEEFQAQAEDDRKAVEDAKANGSSPWDALFGG